MSQNFELELIVSTIPGNSQEVNKLKDYPFILGNNNNKENLKIFDVAYFPLKSNLRKLCEDLKINYIEGIDMLLY